MVCFRHIQPMHVFQPPEERSPLADTVFAQLHPQPLYPRVSGRAVILALMMLSCKHEKEKTYEPNMKEARFTPLIRIILIAT